MNSTAFSSVDYVPLSASDSTLIGMLTSSNDDPADRAALQASLSMLLKQRNLLAYEVAELLNKATSVQSQLIRTATNLQTQLDSANAAVELQYCACLANDEIRRQSTTAGSPMR